MRKLIPFLSAIALLPSACGLEGLNNGDPMAGLPDERDLTLTDADPVPSPVINRLQDCCVVGSHRLRPRFISPFGNYSVEAGNPIAANSEMGVVFDTTGDRILFSVETHGDEVIYGLDVIVKRGSGSSLSITAFAVNPDTWPAGSVSLGSATVLPPGSGVATAHFLIDIPAGFAPNDVGARSIVISMIANTTPTAGNEPVLRGVEVYSKIPIS